MSGVGSDNDYEDDYEDEFEPEASGEQSFGKPAGAVSPDGASSPARSEQPGEEGGGEVVSLEEYMKQLEDAPGGEDGEEENDIMKSITRGLDGLSPSPSARGGGRGDKYGRGSPGQDSEDAILKKFGIELSPRAHDQDDDFLKNYLRNGEKQQAADKIAAMKEKYGYHGNDMDEIARLVERGTHDRSVPEDAGLKVIELKKKMSQLQERARRDNEIKNHLKSICTSLKNELATANQKIEYLYAELQSKKKPKAKKKAVKNKVSEENIALRECVASLESSEASLIEKVEALSAINNELNLQLKQSISREMDWRNAHQELSDRVLKQFSSPERKKGSASVGSLHSVAQVNENNNRLIDQGYGKPKKRPEFRLDGNVKRSESDPRGKRKAKKLPPL